MEFRNRSTICWEDSHSILLLNPRYSQQNHFQNLLKGPWPGHIWLSTSGSYSQKWVGLSKQALLASAAAVNRHLASDHNDRWVNALPDFHVGGLSVWARAYLSGARVFDFKQKWRAEEFYSYIQEVKGTLTALVPTQLHDLVKYPAPKSLRAVIIGGGALLPHLYAQAIALGWPILPSYGLTECASQVATAPMDSWRQGQIPDLQLLSHIQGEERQGHLCFAGPSLMSTYAYLKGEEIEFIDPKIQGWFVSEDLGSLQNGCLHLKGRADKIIKIGGESVDLTRLEIHLQTLHMPLEIEATLCAMPDERLGCSLHLASNSQDLQTLDPLIQQFQQSVLPFERIRKIHLLPELPRSALGKILHRELMTLIHSLAKTFEYR